MPESFEIHPERQLVTCRMWGTMTNEDLRGHYERLVADPAFNPEYRQLGDVRDVTDFAVDSRAIEEVARMRVFTAGARRAFIAPTGVAYGLTRMFSMYSASDGQVMEVFTDAGNAEEWLGL